MVNAPGYWMHETTGVLVPAVRAYLLNKPLTPAHIAAIRAYLRQWMAADWMGPDIAMLRSLINRISTRADLEAWVDRADLSEIDPF